MYLRKQICNSVPLLEVNVEPVQPDIPIIMEPRNITNLLMGLTIRASVSQLIEYILELIYWFSIYMREILKKNLLIIKQNILKSFGKTEPYPLYRIVHY